MSIPPKDLVSLADDVPEDDEDERPACVLAFNANDPSGAGGLAGDILAVASVGGHALAVATGTYVRDSAKIFEFFALDEDAVAEQARVVLEDVPVDAIKVGFAGTPANLGAIAEIAADYDDLPLIAYMPDLSWWSEDEIDAYHDAFRELLLPQTTVLVGNHGTLWRWLLPDWQNQRSPTARDIARAAGESGVPYTLVTGIPLPEQFVENSLCSPQAVLATAKFELFDAVFSGAGDTVTASLTALIANGSDLGEACGEALHYLDRSLDGGFRPGMGNVLPDRLFWAQPEDDEEEQEKASADINQALERFVMPPPDTQH
ncbi:bifunctional hydroxymethylpyrimidine kinase/phosphomethylpyrimidine kinase [Xylophilus sp. GOD-11R]|uniref:bifunctional hydroxymethylpyrimidine kinase/phosphomethylpyrimidine kinase n=1 Tax=Xylophilus sp. GOD-11R TaxID=3089814 RepID=UPI00298CB484|nr:bifunctional hydroxymethylpyrimidine kinase/phosphomethylpyrimidine kinase [Xylophilus sp. GOD-11R]WPB57516.1 bifunctional hydroxymethylpyrimidine kinase/phosphomethylpyrimidine kinase [Xylophilus sp. GOD-11R]